MINKKINDFKYLKQLNKKFNSQKPYPNISIENFFEKEIVDSLIKNLEREKYFFSENDLYAFYRTFDLKNSKNKFIQLFREYILSEEFRKLIFDITNIKVKKNKVDLQSLKLVKTNYLLSHDDDVQKRKIAFVLYLSTLKKNEGGEFEIIEKDKKGVLKVKKTLSPKKNTLNIFRVENEKSYHSIREVLKNKERITIGGWFY